ncbi:hypothetical protein [Streptomyces sp. CB02261]|uniref:hypothetical protein n=1 Tax=Streptomyces sp. CB02261 TaxID=1703940 RepID=UPI000A760633|nr:hypothetical protein [Streptomyces sp. CB02261]
MTAPTRDQALAAAAEGLAILTAEKQRADQTGGNPATDAQLSALADAAALIARTPDPK